MFKKIVKSQGNGFIKCEICGQQLRQINTMHLLFVHNIRVSEYKKTYPNAPLVSPSFVERKRKEKLEWWTKHSDFKIPYGKMMKEFWKSKKLSEGG